VLARALSVHSKDVPISEQTPQHYQRSHCQRYIWLVLTEHAVLLAVQLRIPILVFAEIEAVLIMEAWAAALAAPLSQSHVQAAEGNF